MDFYAYTIENTEDSEKLYTFYSPRNKRIYAVSFDTYLYQDFLEDFPCLLSKGCSLGFYNIPTEKPFRQKHDPLASSTIQCIIQDYLQSQGNECVLLYHCDTQDNRQYCRHLLFDRWYRAGAFSSFIKEAAEATIPVGDEKKKYYIGYITARDNPNLENIKLEFDEFSYYMISLDNFKDRA
jgi:hypothetical protein